MSETVTVELIEKITIAREWARQHFNADNAENPKIMNEDFSLVKPSCFVEFPSPDTMLVNPSIMGTPSGIIIMYKLAFRNDGTMAWNCKNGKFPPLEINQ